MKKLAQKKFSYALIGVLVVVVAALFILLVRPSIVVDEQGNVIGQAYRYVKPKTLAVQTQDQRPAISECALNRCGWAKKSEVTTIQQVLAKLNSCEVRSMAGASPRLFSGNAVSGDDFCQGSNLGTCVSAYFSDVAAANLRFVNPLHSNTTRVRCSDSYPGEAEGFLLQAVCCQ